MVDAGGLRMHVVEMGPEDGEPVILLHGFPELWYSWRYQMPTLAESGYRVIVPDQRGYNLTDKQGPYDTRTLVGDIVHLADALGIEQPHVVGHDWGASIAWAYAAMYPHRVRRVVAMNGPHPALMAGVFRRHPKQIARSWYMFFFQVPLVPERMLASRRLSLLARWWFASANPERNSQRDLDVYEEAARQPGALPAMLGWYRAAIREGAMGKTTIPRRVDVPACVIWGENDFVLGRECNEPLARYVPDLRIHYVPDASHWVQLDKPHEVNLLLLQFLHG
ncbi:MAG: alpha/beta hydrolase [Deltaproteobacteria bacterium]|nr:alpha/beta hydrolase [Deltaproteobacteria bacterium]